MKKIIVLLATVMSLIIFTHFTGSTFAYAKVSDKILMTRPTYESGGSIIVYVADNHSEEVKNFADVDSCMIGCRTCINTWYFDKPDKNSDYNDIDYVIYMVGELEKLAMEYTNNDQREANNCVFGYIRGININYCDTNERNKSSIYDYGFEDFVGGKWGATAGKINKGFVNYVASNEKAGELTFPEFFASFVQCKDDYNSYLYGEVEDSFLGKNYLVPDPLGTGQSIDLLHMFAAIDGIYEKTGKNEYVCINGFRTKYFQKDLLSWLGDLQQFTHSVYTDVFAKDVAFNDYIPAMGYIDFNEYTQAEGFSSGDLLADIDAFNIVKFFVDCEKNSVTNSLLGYYNSINKDKSTKGNRFYEFIYTVTQELEHSKQASLLDNFRVEVCSSLNIKYDNGNYVNYNYYDPTDSIRKNLAILCSGKVYPNEGIRGKCAKLFCEYIIAMSGRR